ncbi:MAG TPA: CsbD family protein [Pseudobdellovibrionaceae bacterium]|jgi:uncharacterized protein YjbJ (UPF0337 family)
MTINENAAKGKWLEIKGDIQKAWGNLTDDDLEKTKGDMKAVGGLIQQKYGQAQESYSKKLSDIFARIESKKDAVVTDVKNNLKN